MTLHKQRVLTRPPFVHFMIDVDGASYLHRHFVEDSPMSGTQ